MGLLKSRAGKPRRAFLAGGFLLLLILAGTGLLAKNALLGRTFVIRQGGKRIYGRLFLPMTRRGPYPLVILGHGYGGSYSDNLDYGRYLSGEGVACYVFDFCGAGGKSQSPEGTEGFSIDTEISDMEDILDAFLRQRWLDEDGIFLAGKSLGGGVAALTGARRPEVDGLILHYPFLVVSEAFRGEGEEEEKEAGEDPAGEGQEEADREDALAHGVVEDVFEKIGEFSSPVLIFNGDRDRYVPLKVTRLVAEAYEDCELIVLSGAGHGFHGADRDHVKEEMVRFVGRVLDGK